MLRPSGAERKTPSSSQQRQLRSLRVFMCVLVCLCVPVCVLHCDNDRVYSRVNTVWVLSDENIFVLVITLFRDLCTFLWLLVMVEFYNYGPGGGHTHTVCNCHRARPGRCQLVAGRSCYHWSFSLSIDLLIIFSIILWVVWSINVRKCRKNFFPRWRPLHFHKPMMFILLSQRTEETRNVHIWEVKIREFGCFLLKVGSIQSVDYQNSWWLYQ